VKRKISQVKKKADIYFSKSVRYRDCELVGGEYVGRCISCDDPLSMKSGHAGHFMSRRYSATRYDEENVNLQCPKCNTFNHGEQYHYSIALDKKYGDGTAKRLAREAQQFHKLTLEELDQIIADAKEAIAFYEKTIV
jgi:hypothetical protein